MKRIFLIAAFLLHIFQTFANNSRNSQPKDDFPLRLKGNCLVSRSVKPFLINGDTPWSLIVGPDKQGAELYLENRRQKGVNSIMVNLIEHYFNGPEDAYGNPPFLTPGDFSNPNPAYFYHADFVIRKAREMGMAVFLFPAYLGYKNRDGQHKEGWYAEVLANGPQKMYEYGKFVGNRYKDFKNIVWMMGGDCAPEEAMDAIRQMVRGIEEASGPQIFSVHNSRFHSGITEYPSEKWIDLNTTYADCSKTPLHLLSDYKRNMPYFYIEGTYENEKASSICLRSQMYWTVLMGSCGYFFATKPVWGFDKDWQSFLDTQGSEDLQRAGEFFRSVNWNDLAPDVDHKILISGFGNISDGSYTSAAVTGNRKTVIIYTPEQRELIIELSQLKARKLYSWWYQPSSGRVFNPVTFQNNGSRKFTPPSSGDWLLVIDEARKHINNRTTILK